MGFSSNLRYRLLLQVLTVTVLLLLAYTCIWITITKNQIINSSTTHIVSSAEEADRTINNYFTGIIDKLTLYTNLQTEPTQQDLERLLDSTFEEIMILSTDGSIKVYASRSAQPSNKKQNMAQSPEFKIASFMGGRTYISPVFEEQGRTYVHIALPLNVSSGVLIAKVSTEPLWIGLQELKLGSTGSVFIVNKHGRIQYHPNTKAFPFNKDIATLSELQRNTVQLEKLPVIEAQNETGEQAFVYHQVNPLTEWTVVAQIPVAEMLQPLNQIYLYAVLLFAAAVLFAVLLSLTLSNSTIVAFRNLKAGFDNFTRGNLAFRVPASGKGELEELSKALNGMIGQIHESYLKVDKQKQAVEAEKAQARREFAAEKERMQHVLSDDREKVNYGLYVEKEKVNAIMSNITDSVILLNKKREILFYNKVAEDLLGHSSQEMQHKLITAVMKVYEKDTEVPWDEYAPMQGAATGVVCKKDKVRIENPSISPRFAKLLTIKTNFNEQDDLGYIIFLHNLSQEIELEKTEMRFVGRVVNELGSAVSVILQCLPSLQQETMDETKKMYMTGIQTGVDQISLLMQNFQLAMQLEEQTVKPNIQQTDITVVIGQVFDILNSQIQMKFITANYHQPEEPVSAISADPANVRDVLLNLIGNAIKFTPAHGTISVDIKQFGNDVLVEVQDGGIGIAKEHIPNLFKKFFTVPDPAVPETIGTGLGLYIAKSLVELNHGKIWADSIEDKGSTFGFSFPKAT